MYYYVDPENPRKVLTTEFIDDLVVKLFNNSAEFINDAQREDLNLPTNYLDTVKKTISLFEQLVPLYDIRFNHVYLINNTNVYERIFKDDYRFVDKVFYQELTEIPEPSDFDVENIRILSHYDFDVLQQTYFKIFYQSFVISSYITSCRRPSFHAGMDHIMPYYTINELYYLAFDWGLIQSAKQSNTELNELCKKISQYDIPSKTLIDHQMYIYDSKSIGLVKHYSLFGSYFINVYLRKHKCCFLDSKPESLTNSSEDFFDDQVIRDLDLENQINIMTNLIRLAPPFVRSHTVYRFVSTDNYLRHLKIGNVYQDPSFMSTTRNPFYYKENYTFGYILIKIVLPANIQGVGICIEAYSNFPREEEIVLPPTTKYRLISIQEDTNFEAYQHVLENQLVKRKYVFEWVGNGYTETGKLPVVSIPHGYEPPIQMINFKELLKNPDIKHTYISERLKYFRTTYVNQNNQFKSEIAGSVYTFNIDSYDASSVYKPFFYYEVSDGIMITTSHPKYGNINLILELGTEIHVNYYFRYGTSDSKRILNLDRPEWIEWFSLLAYSLGSRSVVIHPDYVVQYNENDTIQMKQMKTRFTYPNNIYAYLKHGTKIFKDQILVVPKFDYGQLDYLSKVPVSDVVKVIDRNELYRVAQTSGITNMRDFYLYIVEQDPKLLATLVEQTDRIYAPEVNPFYNSHYELDAWAYLNAMGYIDHIPSDREFVVKKGSFKSLIGDKKIPKFKNRLRKYLLN